MAITNEGLKNYHDPLYGRYSSSRPFAEAPYGREHYAAVHKKTIETSDEADKKVREAGYDPEIVRAAVWLESEWPKLKGLVHRLVEYPTEHRESLAKGIEEEIEFSQSLVDKLVQHIAKEK